MTVRQSLVAKLLVSLEDEQSIENSSPEEIEANLRALGSDPATSIAFAERLAAAAQSSVARRRTQPDGPGAPVDKLLTPQHEAVNAAPIRLARAAAKVYPGEGPAVANKLKSKPRAFGGVGLGDPRAGLSWRRKMAVAACLPLLFVAGAAAYVSRMPRAYESEALVMLNDRQAQLVRGIHEVLSGVAPNEEGLQDQMLLIKSPSMAERLVDQLNLDMLPEFNPALRGNNASFAEWFDPAKLIPKAVLEQLQRAWAGNVTTPILYVETTSQQPTVSLRAEIIENVKANITVEPSSGSTVIGLGFVSTDPQLAALGANTLARLYLAEQLETKQSASRRAREFIEVEIERLRASVASAEQPIEDHRRQAGLGGATPGEQRLAQLTTLVVETRSERAAAEARLRQVQRLVNAGTDLDQAAQMLDSPVLNELRAREIELNRQRAELATEFGERHPRMQNLRSEQAALEERKRSEIRQITNRLNDEVQVLRSREATQEANIDGLKAQMAEYQEAEIGLGALQRDADADRSLLETYINRAKEIASQQKAQEPDARIISRAITPDEPTYPRKSLIFGLALLAGAMLALLWLRVTGKGKVERLAIR